MKMRLNTQTGKVYGDKKASWEKSDAFGTELGYLLANPTMVRITSNKKKQVILEIAKNPFEEMTEKNSNIKPTDKAVKFITEAFKSDGTKNKKALKILVLGISDAANARKIKGKLFYMHEVRRITRAIIRTMDNNCIDNGVIYNLK